MCTLSYHFRHHRPSRSCSHWSAPASRRPAPPTRGRRRRWPAAPAARAAALRRALRPRDRAVIVHVFTESVGAVLPVDSWMVDSGGLRLHAPVAQPEHQWPPPDPATAAAAAAAAAVAEAAAAAEVAPPPPPPKSPPSETPFSGTASIGAASGSRGAAAAAREFPLETRRSPARRRRSFHSGSTAAGRGTPCSTSTCGRSSGSGRGRARAPPPSGSPCTWARPATSGPPRPPRGCTTCSARPASPPPPASRRARASGRRTGGARSSSARTPSP